MLQSVKLSTKDVKRCPKNQINIAFSQVNENKLSLRKHEHWQVTSIQRKLDLSMKKDYQFNYRNYKRNQLEILELKNIIN